MDCLLYCSIQLLEEDWESLVYLITRAMTGIQNAMGPYVSVSSFTTKDLIAVVSLNSFIFHTNVMYVMCQ